MADLASFLSPLDRRASALLAAAIGDALGWPYEANNQRIGGRSKALPTGRYEGWQRRVGSRFNAVEEEVRPGEYSDDTQLLIATARALVEGGEGWFHLFSKGELPAWLLYERGGGRATKSAARLWAAGKTPWSQQDSDLKKYMAAGGNGAAMRILPHVLAPWRDHRQLRRDILQNSITTHGHPRALAGALVYAAALVVALEHQGEWQLGELFERLQSLEDFWRPAPYPSDMPDSWWASVDHMRGTSYIEIWNQTAAEIQTALATARRALGRGALAVDYEVLGALGAFDRETNGAGTVSAVAAIYLASRHAADAATGLRTAAYAIGADTDTLASMTGALLGAMLGNEWWAPDWREVQDAELLYLLSSALSSTRMTETEPPLFRQHVGPWTDRDSSRFREELVNSVRLKTLMLGPIGEVEKHVDEELRSITKNLAGRRWELRSKLGQTIYVVHAQKVKEDRKPPLAGFTPPPPGIVHSGNSSATRPEPQFVSERLLQELSALAQQLSPEISASQFLNALVAATWRVRNISAGRADGGVALSGPELKKLIQDAAADYLPNLSDEQMTLLARLAYRIASGIQRNPGHSTGA